ncbi:MAG TPA: UDP-3-O-(3-hydroxymyristoyl)glucosamine N-acyltransferase [Terriglobia bacterium]|jgi:UDP-3-O-[3-hydroxymyristoyl] glucosamine N-acyltransferase|nr:UDP-3-O-(3-hydroxymyristoyl)glucosamine N-acyltransferase [Terriglobia bacterium]
MTVREIAEWVDGVAQGEAEREIRSVAALESAGPEDLSFAADSSALERAAGSSAGCILIPTGRALEGSTTVAVAHPKLAFIRLAEKLAPRPAPAPGIHPNAVLDPEVSVDPDATVGPYAVIERGARVGPRTILRAGVFVGEGAEIGADCVLHPGVKLYARARLGNRVILHAGVVIGGDGFGYIFAEGRQQKFPQLGGVVIEDDVEIGCNSTIDRGSLGTTVIGQGTKIDNLVQIAHNVTIGRHCVIAAQTGISGSVRVGDAVVIGGQVGIGDHVEIESGARIGSKGGILPGKIVRGGTTVWGIPGRPLDVFKRQYAHLSRLPELARRVSAIERLLRQRLPGSRPGSSPESPHESPPGSNE